jgi:tagaturonate reductase
MMERVLQFGTGRFLRGFVEAFIDEERDGGGASGDDPGRAVTVVESTGSGMATRLAEAGFRYPLRTRGVMDGRLMDEVRTLCTIDAAVDASERDDTLVDAALDPHITLIVSNTTEAGYAPSALPRRLAAILRARARHGSPGVGILPCELVERNGERLRDLVVGALAAVGTEPRVVEHVRDANAWGVTLVDRIATAPTGELLAADGPLGVVVEP